MLIVGLTGGIATGKSTASRAFADNGLTVIDSDALAHGVTRKGAWGYRRVVAAFGSDVLDAATGEINRARLGQLVFSDPALRRCLNRATHLPISIHLLAALAWHWLTLKRIVILDMPLLFEAGVHRWTHPNIVVYVPPGTQVRRLIARDALTPEAALARVRAQMPLDDKLRQADVVLNNEGSPEELVHQVGDVTRMLHRRVGPLHWLLSPLSIAAGLLLFLAASRLGLPALPRLRVMR